MANEPAAVQPDLFSPPIPDPPTGPVAETYTDEEGMPPAFVRFLESDNGVEFWAQIQVSALHALRSGEKRFSCLGFLHLHREVQKVRVNNTYAPWFADMLVAAHPELLEIVERRKRTKPGPFDGGNGDA